MEACYLKSYYFKISFVLLLAMREFIFISHLFLSVLFIATPSLGLNFQLNYQAQEELMCCVDVEADSDSIVAKSCHENDIANQHSCKDTCKDKCQDHAAHVVTHSIEPPSQNAEISIKEEISSLNQSSYFQDLFQQQFTLSFWNPPKQV